jgi:hypothetical protein
MAGSFFKTPMGFLFALLCLFCVAVQADGDSTAPNTTSAATYIFGENDLNVTVSLTAVVDTGDIFFVITAPAGYDWFSFGLGGQMTGAIMFVVYATKNSTCMYLFRKTDITNADLLSLSNGLFSSPRNWEL